MTEIKQLTQWIRRLIQLSLTNPKPWYITDTSVHSNINGYRIKAVGGTDAVFDSSGTVFEDVGGDGDLTGYTLPAGDTLYVKVTDFQLVSGAVIIDSKNGES